MTGPGKLVVGLIGGIGSGKSQVAAALARHGARVIVADQLGHEALRQPEIRDQVVRRWGPDLLDEQGQVVRRRLGRIVFADPGERAALEQMVFPWIGQAIRAEVARAEADPQVRFIVLDAAVMLEAGWHTVCNKIVFVDAPWDVRLQRVQARGWTAQDLHNRENAQLPLTRKVVLADHTVNNSGSLEQLHEQVERLLNSGGWLLSQPIHSNLQAVAYPPLGPPQYRLKRIPINLCNEPAAGAARHNTLLPTSVPRSGLVSLNDEGNDPIGRV